MNPETPTSRQRFGGRITIAAIAALLVLGMVVAQITRDRSTDEAEQIRTVDREVTSTRSTRPISRDAPQTPSTREPHAGDRLADGSAPSTKGPGRAEVTTTDSYGSQGSRPGSAAAPMSPGEAMQPNAKSDRNSTGGGPKSDDTEDDETSEPPRTNEPVTEPPTEVPPTEQPPVEPDAVQCANLGLVEIGNTDGGDEGVVSAGPRFRAMAAEVQAGSTTLVCAKPINAWRDDLYTQSLYAGGMRLGRLVSGRGVDDPVIHLSLDEFAAWQWRTNHDFVGVPTGRVTIDGVEIIRTHRGGVVIESREAIPIPVVNGAWDRWIATGGPSGSMGMPAGRPDGISGFAAWQDFVGGRLVLPHVLLEFEAEEAPASAYLWQTWEEIGPPTTPPVVANSVIELTGASYYVGPDLRRHWIRTTDDWFCAKRSGALMIGKVDGRVLTSFPIGSMYVCPEVPQQLPEARDRELGTGRLLIGRVPTAALVDERDDVGPPRQRLVPRRTT